MNHIARNLVAALLAFSLLAPAAAFAEGPGGSGPGTCPAGRQGQGGPGGLLQKLNLTAEQRQKVQPIMAEFRQEARSRREANKASFESILTAEQKARLEAGRGQGRPDFRSLDLTADQKARLQALRQQNQGQRQADFQQLKGRLAPILTTDQMSQLEQGFKERQEGRHGHHGQRGAGPEGSGR